MTRLGTITYKRAYYYDPHKRQGRYPLDEQLGIRGQLSAGLEREMVLLGAYLPYEAAAQLMERLMRVEASDTTVWRRVQAAGRRVQASDAERVSARLSAPPAPEPGQCQMGASLDGVMVHVRDEGWKEVKLGCVFEVVAPKGAEDPSPLPQVNHAGAPRPDRKACRQSFVCGREAEGRGRRAALASRCGYLGHRRWGGVDLASGRPALS